MKHVKLISLLLAVLLMLSSLTVLSVFGASATEEDTSTDTGTTTDKTEEETTIDYIKQIYTHPEEKLATMDLYLTKGNYELYVDTFSGEVAYRNITTGEILFTNPYDIATSTTGSDSTKGQLLSQIIIQYTDNNTSPVFESYEMAALKDQITVKRIKNGIRVQYTLGREQARKLVPGMISAERYVEMITGPAKENGISDFLYGKLDAYYLLKSLDGVTSERARAELIDAFPIVEKMDVYVFHMEATENERNIVEGLIKTYCPEYTYEELDYDHSITEFVSQDKNPPLFKLSLEYTLDENGMTVRLPANGIRFNESLYALESIQVLPYMGAGNSAYSGYTFFPDGSGSLFAFDTLETTNPRNVNGKVYGNDYAYHTITDTYQQAIRYPVFGVVENSVYYDFTKYSEDAETGEQIADTTRLSGTIVDQVNLYNSTVTGAQDSIPTLVQKYGALIGNSSVEVTKHEVDRGYVAIMEEGDALTDIRTFHAGSLSDYNSVKMVFNPRPSDSYNLQDSISVGSDSTWTVVSERKYVGNYKIRYVMLSDSELAEEKGVEQYYDASWLGMAFAYRDYLDRNGFLTRLTADKLEENIPLYIEAFGALETTQRIMSIPVDVMTPLTTFENVQTMYDELAEAGVTNINFKLTGFANGGMYSIVPSKLKWEKTVGGNDGFQALVNYAAEVNKKENYNLGIFPDFDFSYINYQEAFDGVSLRLHAVKTIDDRYASYREYSATQQKHVSHYQMAISPASFSKFYEKLATNYLKYDNVNGISVSTLGNTLNSDFDEDDPYNRENSKEFVATALEYLSSLKNNQGQEVQVMSEGGNAFTWKYLDHLIDVALDSSRSNDAAHSVPFVGVVLHGYVNFAGTPINMEGNINYAMLKAFENGAAPYYILSYQNTQNLKDYYLLSHYYSVRYDIWKEDVIDLYLELNSVLGDVQDKVIINHEFWNGTRVPDSDELLNDLQAVLDKFLYEEENAGEVLALKDKQAVSIARKQAREAAEAAIDALDNAAAAFKQANDMYIPFITSDLPDLEAYYHGTGTADIEGIEGVDHVCGKDVLSDEEKALIKEAGVSHECGFKVFEELLKSGEINYEAYAEYTDAEKGTEEYDQYQLYLAFRTARSRYSTTKNRRLNDIVTIYNYYATAQTALNEVSEHLEKAEAALALISATEGMLPELIEEAKEYRDLTELYLNGTDFTILKTRFQNDGNTYTIEEDVAAITAYINQKLDEAFVKIETEYLLKQVTLSDEAAAEIDSMISEYKGEEKVKRNDLYKYLYAEKLNELTGEKNDTDDKKFESIVAAVPEIVAYINSYIDAEVAKLKADVPAEQLAADTLEAKQKATLTDEQLAEIERMCHFVYDYSKLYKTDMNDLIVYLRGEKIKAAYGIENTAASIELDFTQSSFNTYSAGALNVFEQLKVAVKDYISEADINNRITPVGSTVRPDEDADEEVFDKYAVEEGSIVVVTYGGKNGVDADPYKSIILNYNNFSVSIVYEDMVYTIPAYGYVVIMK